MSNILIKLRSIKEELWQVVGNDRDGLCGNPDLTGDFKRKRCFYCLVKTAAAARDEPQSHGTTQMKLLMWEHLCILTTEHSNGLVTGGRRKECERERLTDGDFIGKPLKRNRRRQGIHYVRTRTSTGRDCVLVCSRSETHKRSVLRKVHIPARSCASARRRTTKIRLACPPQLQRK